jgi:hypothetical protein
MIRLDYYILPTCTAMLLWVAPAIADHPDSSGPFPHVAHIVMVGVVTKIEPAMLFVQPPHGLQTRTISMNKAERMGLHDVKVGDAVLLVIDEQNVLIDAHRSDLPPAGHRIIAGTLNYADKFWEDLGLSTPEGSQAFTVDSLAGSKLGTVKEGELVTLELDEANVVIDIHRDQ